MKRSADSAPAKGLDRTRRKLLGFGALLILAALLVAIVANGVAAAKHRRAAESWFVHTYGVLLLSSDLKASVQAALRSERGYLLARKPIFLTSYGIAKRDLAAKLPELERLTADNPVQRAAIADLKRANAGYFRYLEDDIRLSVREPGRFPARRVAQARDWCERVLRHIARIEAEEYRLLALRRQASESAAEANERYGWLLVGLCAVLLLAAGAAGVSSLRAWRRAEEMMEQLRHTARTDALTNLPNRRALFERLDVETARSIRHGSPLSLAIVDVDHFKRINDLHGHPAGDEVLRIVADVAQQTMRATDVVGRIGGEEFAVVMPDTSIESARRACERLREAVAERCIGLPGGAQAAITLSTGVALLRRAEEIDRFVARADAALYAAKNGGRNQVKLAA